MKHLNLATVFLIPGLLFLTACSHLEVLGFDNKANAVSVQTGRWDTKDEAKEAAHKYCASRVTLTNPDAKANNDGMTIYTFTCDR